MLLTEMLQSFQFKRWLSLACWWKSQRKNTKSFWKVHSKKWSGLFTKRRSGKISGSFNRSCQKGRRSSIKDNRCQALALVLQRKSHWKMVERQLRLWWVLSFFQNLKFDRSFNSFRTFLRQWGSELLSCFTPKSTQFGLNRTKYWIEWLDWTHLDSRFGFKRFWSILNDKRTCWYFPCC
jgi:hypothetical protein